MARIVFAWELGSGWGHIAPIAACAQAFLDLGHEVIVIGRDLARLAASVDLDRVRVMQAPQQIRRLTPAIAPVRGFADILHNEACGSPDDLQARTSAWLGLLEYFQPDLLVADHSPTAICAARCARVAAAIMGTGFFVPPPISPWPAFAESDSPGSTSEVTVLETVNLVLQRIGGTTVDSLAELYSDVLAQSLITYPELDHYARSDGDYWPVQTPVASASIPWSDAWQPEVFAYLKPHRSLPVLLDFLRGANRPTAVVLDASGPISCERWAAPNFRVYHQPLAIERLAAGLRFAVLNGNHATTIDWLLHGKPVWQLPVTVEQRIFSERASATGACLTSSLDDPASWSRAFKRMLEDDHPRSAAAALQQKWKACEGRRHARALAAHWLSLLESRNHR